MATKFRSATATGPTNYAERLERHKKPVVAVVLAARICLRCDKSFESSSKFNRLCWACKNSVEFQQAL